MARWKGINIYKKFSAALAEAEERNFERASLPVLRILWPNMVQVPARWTLDQQGIDLVSWMESGECECVVQCKGFQLRELGPEQERQAIDSIRKFRRSGQTVHTYLLVHNRDAHNLEFNAAVQQELGNLVADGQAHVAELWDRHTLLDAVFDGMKEALEQKIRVRAQAMLARFQEIFEFNPGFVASVPFSEQELRFRRYEPCEIVPMHGPHALNVADAIVNESMYHRWTMVSGVAGSGKTTTLLQIAASSQHYTTILVSASTLLRDNVVGSASMLTEEIIKSLHLLDDVDELDYRVQKRVAGAVLGRLLRSVDGKYMLVIDGLDENRAYADHIGLETLNNQLADFRCPIVLSTRTEHLYAMFGDFSTAFFNLTHKGRSTHTAKYVVLAKWEIATAVQLVNQAIASARGKRLAHLQEFSRMLESGNYFQLYGDMPLNPLFLQFMLEDVAENGVRRLHRTDVIASWIRRKIRRDRERAARLPLWEHADIEETVAASVQLLEHVAYRMTERQAGAVLLLEEIEAEEIRQLAETLFHREVDTVLRPLLHSLMVPTHERRLGSLHLGFIFRVLHEYLLARQVLRTGEDVTVYPAPVQDFYAELVQADHNR